MPDMWVSKEARELCYKNKGTFDSEGRPRTIVHHIDFNHDNNDPENLIFLSVQEHNSLHARNRPDGFYERFKGSGNPNADGHSMLGKHHSCTGKENIRASQLRPEVIAKKSAKMKGLVYWNDGKINKRSRDCPGEGFVKGKLKK